MSSPLRTALTNGRIIDGTGAVFTGHLVIEGARILAVGEGEPPAHLTGDGARVEDLGGRTVLPGMIDCHVHLSMDALAAPSYAGGPRDMLGRLMVAAKNALASLHGGITTVRDCGTPGEVDFALREAAAAGLCITPRLILSGRALCMTGGHGWQLLGVEVDGPDEARKAARAQLKAGADNVKVIATGGILTQGTEIGSPQLTVAEMRAAADEAHNAGKIAAAHAHGAQGIKNAARAGVDSIEHAYFIDAEGIELMLEHGTTLVATSAAVRNVVHHGTAAGIPAHSVAKAQSAIDAHVSGFKAAHKAGVKMAMGTDSGVPFTRHGRNLDELGYLVEMGMTPMKAIQTATRDSARLLKLDDRIGTLEPGKLADLLVVEGDPLADITLLRDPEAIRRVVLDGRTVVDRDASRFLVGSAFGGEVVNRAASA
ncbi:amidohydrolase family protein [Paracoccus sp. S-4012]|uniref:metal-dependent hydrolase family protein n=1 Tax=Paracoccus sp. S-4012 TaxID=2665648 RepID=UPI0012B12D7D|nr:amidohydrolase family protein [Paracoccus sp. S-4012]MRX52013.1 amidohydrolase family protein [Paracoccus sp. S-4012]